MVPQLVQGFLQPRTRGGTGNPQRLQVGRTAWPGLLSGRTARLASPTSSAARLRRSAVSAKPVGSSEERIGEPLHTNGGVEPVSAVHDRRVGQGQKFRLDSGHQGGDISAW